MADPQEVEAADIALRLMKVGDVLLMSKIKAPAGLSLLVILEGDPVWIVEPGAANADERLS